MQSASGAREFAGLPSLAWRFLLVGFVIRELFSFWTGHPFDLESWVRTGFVVSHGTNPYLHAWPPVPGSFGYSGQAIPSAAYLPFWPGVFGGTYWVWQHVGFGNPLVLYLLLKQGPIAGDLAVAILLYRFVLRATSDSRQAVRALAFWSLFPYDIVIGSIWGQLDSVTTALILGVLLVSESRAAVRSLGWGLGILIKWVTAIYLPFELFRQRGWRRIWPFLGALVPVGVTLLVFLGTHWTLAPGIATAASQGGGGGGGMNFNRLFEIPVLRSVLSSNPWLYDSLNLLWVPACILAGWMAARWVLTPSPAQEVRALLLVMTVFLLFRWGLNEQYFLYPFALLVADIYTHHPQRRSFLYYLVGVAFAYLLLNGGFGIWFASPVSPASFAVVQAFDNSPVGGQIRFDLLYGLSVLVTVSLAQLLWVLYRDEAAPEPWIFRLSPLRWIRRWRVAPALPTAQAPSP